MPTIAPIMIIQMKRKRAISSVQIKVGTHGVCRDRIWIVTGTTRMATVTTSMALSSR